jgi:hypothetical protein
MTTDDDPPESITRGPDERPQREPRRMSDTVKKALSQGFRAARSGEEKIRGMVSDAMPKELVPYIKGAIDSAREEVVKIVGTQTRKFLEGIDVGGEIAKILTALSFEIKTEIRFIPNDQKIKPEIKTTVRPKRVKPEPDDDAS